MKNLARKESDLVVVTTKEFADTLKAANYPQVHISTYPELSAKELEPGITGLFVSGMPGSGKTQFVCQVMKGILNKKLTAYRASIHDLMDPVGGRSVQEKLMQAYLAIIEDIDDPVSVGYNSTEAVRGKILQILKEKIENSKSIVILTCCVSLDNLEAVFGLKFSSMIYQYFKPVVMKGSITKQRELFFERL